LSSNQRGLFVDFDGTLADTVPMLRKTYFNFLEGYGHTGSNEEFDSLMGPSLREIAGLLKDKYALQPTVDELVQHYRDLILEFYVQSAPMAGAPGVLQRAHEAGWVIAVVTSASERDVQEWLTHNSLDQFVAVVVGSESVSSSKPDPEPYLTALSRCACEPRQGVALEDTRTGATSAIAAGLSTFVIGPSPLNAGDWPGVKGFVNSFEQLAETILDV
jgi:HAD superfamily hydrolase (TIGR01509 family)